MCRTKRKTAILHYTDDLVRADAETDEAKNADLPQHAVFGRKHIGQLVDIVAASPLVHRDLHPDNMYITQDGSLLLNDWGLAVEPGTQVTFVGVEQYVSFEIFAAQEAKSLYTALRKDDLLAVVRVAYRMLHPHDFKRIAQETPAVFWKARLAYGHWAEAEAAAAADNPDNLKALLENLMPW
jgi:serine/threonine protein kinase